MINNDAEILVLQQEAEKLRKREAGLRQEIVKAISGESNFDTALLNQLEADNNAELEKVEAKIETLSIQKSGGSDLDLQIAKEQAEMIVDWAEEFDQATTGEKRMILARMIEKITVDKKYNIVINFRLSKEQLTGKSEPA